MREDYNPTRPLVMHIDLNSCFATVEQQARPMLRGRPVAILNRRTEHTMIITCSYEAKAMGVKLGMSFKEAKRLCPQLVGLESDPPKYRYVYHKLMEIMRDYSPSFTMKSIDEGVIDFAQSPAAIRDRDMVEVAQEIKHRLRTEIGCAMRCNIGIAPNRFLAKTAAGLNKPDGLNVIDHANLREVLGRLKLQDLTGIASRNEHRLVQVGIMTPLQFLDTDAYSLRTVVFKSICGDQWHQRLRGWEVDDVVYDLKTCGRQYVLESRQLTRVQVSQRLHHLVESVGSKLRSQQKCARGVGVYVRLYGDTEGSASNGRWGRKGNYWHEKYLSPLPFYSDAAIWAIARRLFAHVPPGDIREIGVHCYHLTDDMGDQLSLFGNELIREQQMTTALDEINQRYGNRTIHSADTLGTGVYVKQKIPFGSTRYL
jgi:DNA polymerase-4